MVRGDKSTYTNKQKRQAEHIVDGYEQKGVSHREAERRAWATVNKESGGGNKSGSGCGIPDQSASARDGDRSISARQRSEAAKKGWETRRRQRG